MALYESWCKVLKEKVGVVEQDEVNSNEAARLELGFLFAAWALGAPLGVCGSYSMSIFDGCGGMSLALAMESIPTICPWEVNRDGTLDVVKNAGVLWQFANSRRISFSWIAMPCRSWTLARKPMLRCLPNLSGKRGLRWLVCRRKRDGG